MTDRKKELVEDWWQTLRTVLFVQELQVAENKLKVRRQIDQLRRTINEIQGRDSPSPEDWLPVEQVVGEVLQQLTAGSMVSNFIPIRLVVMYLLQELRFDWDMSHFSRFMNVARNKNLPCLTEGD